MDNQRQADDLEKAILAGFFAGEGCIYPAISNKKKSRTPTVNLYIGNTEEFWPHQFKERYGGSVRCNQTRKQHLPYYRWHVSDYKAEVALKELLPFLKGEKFVQALLVLEILRIKHLRTGSSGHHSPENLHKIEGLFEEFKQYRRAVAETKRSKMPPTSSDSPILSVMAEK